MSKESVPSKPIQIVDLPEVTAVESTAVYNFFVNDEMINESGNTAVNGNLSDSLLRKGTADTANLNARTPRYVKLSFAVEDTPKSILGKKSTSLSTTPAEVLEALNNGSVYTEEATAGTGFDNYVFGYENIITELSEFWSRKFTSLGPEYEEASMLDMLEAIQENVTEPSTELLESMMPSSLSPDEISSDFLSAEKKHYMVGMLNTAYAPYMLKREVVKGTGLCGSENMLRHMASVSNKRDDEDRFVSDDEYLFDVPLTSYKVSKDPDFVAEAQVVGYLFEKQRVIAGKSYVMDPVFVLGENIREAYDSQVAYGQTYRYRARSIAKFRVPITDWDTGKTYIGEFFFASRLSAPTVATITEDRRPEPPSDVSYYYDYGADNLLITWSPPVNPQRDVKYIQIFRRSSITEPFTLLAHYDFDDSVIVQDSEEDVNEGLVIESETMPTYYVDTDFNSTKSYIYAIVCIDARQMSSYYSTQTMISFDTTTQKLQKKFISYQGAPKQYPNWYLKENFFPDSIKDSNHEQVNIYFNPEAYTLIKSSGEEVPAFYSTDVDPDAKYLFQFMNVDRLAEHQIDIQIEKTQQVLRKQENRENWRKSRRASRINRAGASRKQVK